MQLEEQGKLKLDSPVSCYLEDQPDAWRPQKSPTYTYYKLDRDRGERIVTETLHQVNEDFRRSYRADAGVFSTATEMAHWLLALLNGKFLKQESIRTMWTPVRLSNGEYDGFDPSSMPML